MSQVHFAPFVPEVAQPFNRRLAAHLLRRSGLGASPVEIEAALDRGLEATVDSLFAEAQDEEAEFQRTFQAIRNGFANFADPGQLQAWWVQRMVKTRVPLREKLTLFWHGHFATSYNKVEDTFLMHQQLETLRRHAWGNFRALVMAMAKDPAMLVWLDGEANTKEHPNENFARELMELFTCGIGHYTERDVLEAARAFTGWHRDGGRFVFRAEEHDFGPKQFLGRTGPFDGTDIIDMLLQQPATPRFLAAKLLRFFAAPEPAPEVVAEAAERLRRLHFNIRSFLRELFLSQFFYSAACYRQRISSPVELVVGAVRSLEARYAALELKDHLKAMGQELLAPPNVKGWDGEKKWINSSTLPARMAFAEKIAGLNSDNPFADHLPLERVVPAKLKEPRQVVEVLADRLLSGELSRPARQELAAFLVATAEGPKSERFRDDEGFRFEQTRQALSVLLGLPEYQIC